MYIHNAHHSAFTNDHSKFTVRHSACIIRHSRFTYCRKRLCREIGTERYFRLFGNTVTFLLGVCSCPVCSAIVCTLFPEAIQSWRLWLKSWCPNKYTHKPQKADVGRGVDGLRTDGRKDVYYLYNFCYTFEHHLILIFKSIPKVKRVCIRIWNIHIHVNLASDILLNVCLTKFVFQIFLGKTKQPCWVMNMLHNIIVI